MKTMNHVKHYWAYEAGRGSIAIYRLAGGHEADRLMSIGSGHDDWKRLSEVAAQAVCERLDELAAAEEDQIPENLR